MHLQIGIILAIMVVAYALAKWKKLSVELSMLTAAGAGGIAGAFLNTPPLSQLARHLVEGSFTYLDVILVFTTATIIMAIVMAVQRIPIPQGRTLVTLILMGAIGYVSLSFTYFSALTMAPVGLVVILFYIYPSLVTLQAALFLNSPITKIKIAALLLSFVGIVLVVGLDFGGAPTLGVALGVASAVIFSIYMIVGSKVISKTDSFSASTIVIIAAAVVFGIIVALKGLKFPTIKSISRKWWCPMSLWPGIFP